MAIAARKQPLYDQLVDILTEKIEHEYRPGDMLPSERELSKYYGLSRTTVRLALQELERLGLVVRQHGRGTFVADRSVQTTNLSQTYSFTEQMRELGRKPATTILEFSEIESDKNLASSLGVRIGDKLFKIKRLRSADGVPMMVERTYLPVRKFMSLKRPMLEHESLYHVIEQYFHEKIRVAEEEFFASIARPADAHLLDISEGAPVLDLVRTTYNMGNEIIEYTLSVARADQFKYKIFHYRNE
ncbi:GntR family transcriptional regulator [Collinsella tanakaei]|uniref:GntR family transcriptional regulator n=1 Tax=Collinsella ihumii TaxID=1720204 RepID=A0ABT7XE86_9ACTN|nr:MULTISPECIES: GntR family transcriptional regulator [Collinsella]MBM6687492.1 GntR family transcriptional regulator [Collinsella tanakaei]MBM6777446.1 GntR family transcriptional regulator [Collinsella tanakaei]MBM6786168.1 GntR family transcriptional regulator [Collinsella tanakaei]MBM6905387.1 GntR family transcriptional regulator [Collinsella tanakaei]MCF6413074.1 GntR family transcriptional regulator [Collinsella tanakaei]